MVTRVRTRANGQSGHLVPPANQDASMLVTPMWPKTTSTHTATRHASTRGISHGTVQN